MTRNLYRINVIGRYGQGQHPALTSRSQGQSQGHKGCCRCFGGVDLENFLWTLKIYEK